MEGDATTRSAFSAARVVVFAGPTLYPAFDPVGRSGEKRHDLPPGLELRPPAARGDVLRAVAGAPAAIVLLDGVYFTEPSVTHKELLYALEAGVRVIGAASLGALRAVELAPHGMVGVGRVFERFRDGELDGDDEMALLHAPAEQAYRPLTVALVELREAAEELARRGLLPGAAGAELVAAVKALPFSDRTLDRVREIAGELAPAGAVEALARRLREPGVKWRDALDALTGVATEAAAAGSARRPPTAARTPETEFSVWFKEEHVRPGGSDGEAAPTLFQALRAVQLLHPEAPALLRRLRLRFLLATEGRRAGLEPAPEEVEALAATLPSSILPSPERAAEARVRLLAGAASRHHGGAAGALASLARRLGLPPGGAEAELLALVASRQGLFPDWAAARGLALSSALPPALDAAAAAEEIHRCFVRWRGGEPGARVASPVLVRMAADLWGAPPNEVHGEAVRRGLYPSSGHSPGLFEALEWIAPAERLPEPVNRYPEARAALLATDLDAVCPLPELRPLEAVEVSAYSVLLHPR